MNKDNTPLDPFKDPLYKNFLDALVTLKASLEKQHQTDIANKLQLIEEQKTTIDALSTQLAALKATEQNRQQEIAAFRKKIAALSKENQEKTTALLQVQSALKLSDNPTNTQQEEKPIAVTQESKLSESEVLDRWLQKKDSSDF